MKNIFLFVIAMLLFSYLSGQTIIAHYPLNGSGEDIGQYNLDAALNGPIPTKDRFFEDNQALYFDGVNDYLEIVNESLLNFEACDFAISFWFKTINTDMQMLIHNGSDGTTPQYWIRLKDWALPDIDIRFFVGDGNPGAPSVSVTDEIIEGDWHHVVVQRSNATYEIYYDGVLSSTFTGVGIVNVDNSDNILIGAQHPHPQSDIFTNFNHFRGSMDDIIFFKGKLSEEEITDLYSGNPVSVENTNNESQVNVFPNPVKDELWIENKDQNILFEEIRVLSNDGKLIKLVSPSARSIKMTEIPSGIYYIQFIHAKGTIVKKIVVQR